MKKNILITILILIIALLSVYILSRNIPAINPIINITTGSKSLDLSNRNLTEVPQYVFKETQLETLDLSNNQLTGAIPGEIRFLLKLKTLDLSNNQLTGVPAEVGQLLRSKV